MPVLPRTAVIVVHGIGEQAPLETLLSFVGDGSEGGLLEPKDAAHRWVNPDRVSPKSYRRVVSVDVTHRRDDVVDYGIDRVDYADTVHFYEHYWAYRFRDTVWRQLPPLAFSILRARRRDMYDGFMRGATAEGIGIARAIAFALVIAGGAFLAWGAMVPWPGSLGCVAIAGGAFLVSTVLANWLGVVTTIRVLALIAASIVAGVFVGSLLTHAGVVWLAIGAAGVLLVRAAVVCWILRTPLAAPVALSLAGVVCVGLALFPQWQEAVDGWRIWSLAFAVLATIVPVALGGFALRGLGDAARYLSNHPDNVEERERVRAELIELMRGIEARVNPTTNRSVYDRIVLVGHSLGTVIAYDALLALWHSVAPNIKLPDSDSSTGNEAPLSGLTAAVQRVEAFAATLPEDGDLTAWEAAQRDLSDALRSASQFRDGVVEPNRHRWIITDLVTLATPLTHADLVLASGKPAFRKLVEDRLYASDPPKSQRHGDSAIARPFRYRIWAGREYTTRFHQAAVFAPTVWTNLYFRHDLVGGPVRERFGWGAHDIAVGHRAPRLINFLFWFPHTAYWKKVERVKSNAPLQAQVLDHLRSIIFKARAVLVVTVPAGGESHLSAFLEDIRHVGDIPNSGSSIELKVLLNRSQGNHRVRRIWVWPGRSIAVSEADIPGLIDAARTHGLQLRLTQRRTNESVVTGEPDQGAEERIEQESAS